MNYIDNICYEQYQVVRKELNPEQKIEFPEKIPSNECDTWYKKISIEKLKNISIEEKMNIKNQKF